MTQASPRPLHRLTPLLDDPLVAWLTPPQRLRVAMTGWVRWGAFGVLWLFIWYACLVLLPGLIIPTVIALSIGAALALPWRRMILRTQAERATELIRTSAPAEARAVDDLAALGEQPDGTIVSLVGWVQAGAQLAEPVCGEPAIGLAMACHQKYPGVLETLNDFELVDEAGNVARVQVAGARMLGESNVNLTDAHARRMLVASLDLPVGAVATGWDAFVLRNGDPVMVIGFKQTALDPTRSGVRATPTSAAVSSLAPKPLLIFPIAAERRGQAPTMFNIS